MAVDIQEVASDNQEELPIQDLFKNYKAEGGVYDEALFEEILKNSDKIDIKSLNPATQLQAHNLASLAGIEDSDKTTAVYGLMRTQPMELSAEQTQQQSIVTSSDQVLYAEALLMTGKAREYVKFVNKYPNIFKKPA